MRQGRALKTKNMSNSFEEPLAQRERLKYEKIWTFKEYRESSPGLRLVDRFLKNVRVLPENIVIDFGVGSGKAAKEIKQRTSCFMIGVDIAQNCLDPDVKLDWFICTNLWKKIAVLTALDACPDWNIKLRKKESCIGYCTDVMEHIPEEKIKDVFKTIACAAEKTFFNVALFDDSMGQQLIGESLHLTVKPKEWWGAQLTDVFSKVVSLDEKEGLFLCAL